MGVDQEAPAIATRDKVRSVGVYDCVYARLEERFRGIEGRTRSHSDSHQLPIFGEIVDLEPIAPPARLISPVGRHEPFPVRPREGLDVHLKFAGFV